MKSVRIILLIFYFILLVVPLITIFNNFPSNNNNKSDLIYLFLRFTGLLGIVLLFVQLIIGAFKDPLTKLFGNSLLSWHVKQGIITYGIILSHPLLYTIFSSKVVKTFNPLSTLWPDFSDPNEFYISFGRLALYLLTIGIIFAIFRSQPFLIRHWRKFHILNYIAFTLILIHSWNVGSDTQNLPFVFLYPVFILGLGIALLYRRIYRVITTTS